mmetsp:Transcript_72482/g.130456  ORF Transcript_72482/g.130456 Transcript_72482/m.130456 type:complete len:325 (-) Transcript_72482:137-1111(-)
MLRSLEANHGDAITEGEDHLLQLRVIPDPSIELANGISKVAACRLGVVGLGQNRIANVECVVSNDHAIFRQQLPVHECLKVVFVLSLVRIDEDEVKLDRRVQDFQRVQCRAHDDLVLLSLWEVLRNILDPCLEVRINVQGSHCAISRQGLCNGHGTVACEHPNLKNLLGPLHVGEHLHKLSFHGVRGHLSSIREHSRLRLCQSCPVSVLHLLSDGLHGGTLGRRVVPAVRVNGANEHVHLLGKALDALREDGPLRRAASTCPLSCEGLFDLSRALLHLLGAVEASDIGLLPSTTDSARHPASSLHGRCNDGSSADSCCTGTSKR